MGRGLGTRQRAIMDHLAEHGGAFVSDLCADPDDANERKYVLAAVKGLRRRGLVVTWRQGNPHRTVTEERPHSAWWGAPAVAYMGESVRQVNETYVAPAEPEAAGGLLGRLMTDE